MKTAEKRKPKPADSASAKREPYRVRLPSFVSEEVGLGDVIKRATSAIGIKPCGGCQSRAAAFNRWVVFSHRRQG
jgi:hypothetical protein